MKERPTLMSAPMVRAILAGTKTQTRRVVKPQPPASTVAMGRWQDPGPEPAFWAFTRDGPVVHDHPLGGAELHGEPWRCPYGQRGDWLWLREAWRTAKSLDAKSPSVIGQMCMDAGYRKPWAPLAYEADGHQNSEWRGFEFSRDAEAGKLRPSMFMPRWASRITLGVTGVRVERLQDISEADAKAEGVILWEGHGWYDKAPTAGGQWHVCATDAYRTLWESINGPGSWDANPWVWVVEFRRSA